MDFQNTDLALEVQEQFEENQVEVPGVVLRKKRSADGKVLTTFVEILDKEGEKAMGKPVGIYVTMESRKEIQKESALKEAVCQELRGILGKRKIQSVLVAGVGNRQITSDSLGPETIDRLIVTRHLYDDGQKKGISAIAPGVMGQTGMEAQEVLYGIVSATKPDCVLVVDALMAEMEPRLFDLDFQLLADSLLTIIAVFVLFIALSYLLFNPARKFMQDRQNKIAGELDHAKTAQEDAEKLKADYEARLANVDKEADEILSAARAKALANEADIVAKAREEASRIIAHAHVEAELEKKKAADEIKQEMVGLAMDAAGKFVRVSMDDRTKNALIEETLAEIGENTWLS